MFIWNKIENFVIWLLSFIIFVLFSWIKYIEINS